MKEIQNIYDNEKFFNDYKEMRDSKINANELIEIPIMKSMLPDVKGMKILDIGCGEGEMARYFAKNGAKSVLGLDISQNMIDLAKQQNIFNNVSFKILAMENLSTLNEKYDMIFSSLAVHYIEDFEKLMQDISSLLNPNGILLFSQEHPIVLAPILQKGMKKYTTIDDKRYYYFSDYNNNGKRSINWNVDGVIKYHRNFSTIVNSIVNAGMNLVEVKESTASEKAIELVEKYKYQKDRPFFAFFKAVKK